MHKKMTAVLCSLFKKSERIDFCIDFLGGVVYIIVSEVQQANKFD
jgi:hypothetical protein